MQVIIVITLIIGTIWIITFFVSAFIMKRRIIRLFRTNNTITFGKKGTGKDAVTQEIIACRKTHYYGNIDYGGNCTIVTPNDMSLSPNTYKNFIKGQVVTIPKKYKEDSDWYFSDAGIILPSQYDSQLHKDFPSFPIFYALSRHISNSNVHINTQNIERTWKALREQADYFIKTLKTTKTPFGLIVRVRLFDRYQSAVNDIRPIKRRLLNKFSKGTEDMYRASNGEILEGRIIVWRWHLKYDTRAYHRIIYGEQAPSKRKQLFKRKAKADK